MKLSKLNVKFLYIFMWANIVFLELYLYIPMKH